MPNGNAPGEARRAPLPNGRLGPLVYASVMGPRVRTTLAGAVAWLVLVGLLAAEFWPTIPTTTSGWVLFVLLGPPTWVLVEGVVGGLWASRAGRALSEHPSFAVRIVGGVIVLGTLWVIYVAGMSVIRDAM